MKLTKFKSNPDWIRFSKTLDIDVNSFISVKAEMNGSLCYIDSEVIPGVSFIDETDGDISYYLGGKLTKFKEFKELYGKLFTDSFNDLEGKIINFAEDQIRNSYENDITSFPDIQVLHLLHEQIELAPEYTAEDSCGEFKILSNYWVINEILHEFKRRGYNTTMEKSERFRLAGCNEESPKKWGVKASNVIRKYNNLKSTINE